MNAQCLIGFIELNQEKLRGFCQKDDATVNTID